MDYEIFDLGDVTLQSGVTLPSAFLAYKTSIQPLLAINICRMNG